MSTSRAGLVHAFFFLSGAASLACEVTWFKWFGLAIGNTTQSASVVVTVFFVGLGLGAYASGRFADRWARPLRTYGALELLLAFVSLATSTALARWDAWIPALSPWMAVAGGGPVAIKLGLAFALLLPPTLLMGSTLPLLSRWVVQHRDELGVRVAALYAWNTLGAAVGCLSVGFLGIAALGVYGSAVAASAVYAAIGLGALGVSRAEAPAAPVPDAEPATVQPEAGARVLVAAFAASGFLAVSYEILWFRLLAIATLNTVYVFATLLAVYLCGLVIGAALAARLVARDRAQSLAHFARAQLGVAIAGVVALALLGRVRTLLQLWGADVLSLSGVLAIAVLSALVLLPPSVIIGLTFPLASELTVTRMSGLGARLGLVLAANTIVGALGSLVTGMVLLPAFGSWGTALALTFGNLALFAALAARFGEIRTPTGTREALLTALSAAVMYTWLGPSWLRDAQTAVNDATVLDFRETADGTFALYQYEEDGVSYQQVAVNGTSYANNRPPGRHYMVLLSQLPILLHPEPERVVVICIGTGTTVGSASIADRVRHVSAVDLSPQIFALAPYFDRWNHSFYANPKVDAVPADGRHFLLVSPDAFDVLTFEPPPPIEAGVANLYSREFYALARQRAAPGALVAQWIPFHQGFQDLQKSMVRAALEEFPHVSLWLADNQEGILLGSDAPLALDPAALAARMAEPDVAEELHDVGISDPADLLALFLMADDDLRAWAGAAEPVTDDRPVVERFLGWENSRFDLGAALAARTPLERVLVAPMPDAGRQATATAAWVDVWEATVRRLAGDPAGAVAAIEAAREKQPANPYLDYRAREYRRALDR